MNKEELYLCRNASIYDIVSTLFSSDYIHETKDTLRSKYHNSLVVRKGFGWYHFSAQRDGSELSGGRNPIDFLQKYHGMSFLEAVSTVGNFLGIGNNNYTVSSIETKLNNAVKERMQKPPVDKTNNDIIRYLVKNRGLSENIIKDVIDKGLLFQTSYGKYHNLCFYNHENGHFEISGTEQGSRFKQTNDGKYAWEYKIGSGEKQVIVFESAIDALSYLQLYSPQNTTLLSLGGSCRKQLLDSIIAKYKDKVILALDNDDAGNAMTKKYPFIKRIIPEHGVKDWNELLCLLQNNV